MPLGAAYFPLRWLLAAYWDVRRAPLVSLSFSGLVIGVVSFSLANLYTNRSFYLLLPIALLLILMAPSFFYAFVDMSRRLESNRSIRLKELLAENSQQHSSCCLVMGTLIIFLLVFWLQMTLILFAFAATAITLPLEKFSWGMLLSAQTLPWTVAATLCGTAVAIVIFSTTVIASALLMDRSLDVLSAMRLSATSARRNWPAIATWGSVVTLLAGLGLAISSFTLVFIMPLIGHASWHAYRDMIAREPRDGVSAL